MRDTSGLIPALNALVASKGSPAAASLVHSIIRHALAEHDERIAALESTVRMLRSEVSALKRS